MRPPDEIDEQMALQDQAHVVPKDEAAKLAAQVPATLVEQARLAPLHHRLAGAVVVVALNQVAQVDTRSHASRRQAVVRLACEA